jgi:hypothetical protein
MKLTKDMIRELIKQEINTTNIQEEPEPQGEPAETGVPNQVKVALKQIMDDGGDAKVLEKLKAYMQKQNVARQTMVADTLLNMIGLDLEPTKLRAAVTTNA